MKQGVTDARHDLMREPRILSLIVSVGLHGAIVMALIAGTWLWGAAAFKPLPSYTVALVDVPLSLQKPTSAVKPKPQAPSPKVSASKPSPPKPKPVNQLVKPKPPPSKTVKPIAKPKPPVKPKSSAKPTKTPAKPKRTAAVSPKKTKVPPRPPVKPPAATSAEAESAIARLRQRQDKQESERQQAETAAQQAAAQRLADLRQQVSRDDAVGRAAVQAASLRQVRLAAYQERLRAEIIDAWVLPLPPERSRELQATTFFRVARDGRVEQLSLVQASGNTLFDASLIRAIKRASPLPPLPADYPADVLEVEMRFRAREF